jgi:hypothetical protein
MAPARQQPITARERDRFPTEWALYEGDEQECGQASHQLGDARPGDRAPVSPAETIGRPASRSARLDRQLDGAA